MVDAEALAFNNYDLLKNQLRDIKDEQYIMQYTGLKDKNGKEIYEGDVIKSESPMRRNNKDTGEMGIYFYRIGWHESGRWNKFETHSDDHIGIKGITLSCLIFYEVIGNIYQNPELLK